MTILVFQRTLVFIKEILMYDCQMIHLISNTCFFEHFSSNSSFCCFSYMNCTTYGIEVIFTLIPCE